ncbi:MAG TPA: hypothetical protein VJ949_10270 [Cryomorphaceae bacterium]|nr:hypothetical protein [Cryomorphaceae bacterium]
MSNIPRLSLRNLPLRIILFAAAILVLTSCGENSTEKQQADGIEPDSSSERDIVYTVTAPITAQSIKTLQEDFSKEYSSSDGLNNGVIKVAVSDTLINIIKALSSSDDRGLVFHYGFIEETKEICLLMGVGTQNKGEMKFSHEPFPATSEYPHEYHLLLAANEIYMKPKTEGTFNKLTDSFKNKITQNKISISTNADHPKMIYHQGKELKLFYDEYQVGKPLHLYVYNGSGLTPGVTQNYYTPIFLFGNETIPFPTDDIDYVARGLNEPYRNKGMDAGHVCPPHCKSSVPQPQE